MDAKVVYQVVKALPKKEQKLLFDMLQQDISRNISLIQVSKKPILNKAAAIKYLLDNVFNKKTQKHKILSPKIYS